MFNKKIASPLFAAIAAFLTYTVVFGFRKSFTIATYNQINIIGLNYKSCMVILQLFGYMLAKFYGIKFIGELKSEGRYKIIFSLVAIAWFSWLLFAIVPAPYNIIFLFTNGFPLGMLWGVVFSYVEGRKSTDFIGAALATSFIFASGFVKTVGAWLQNNFTINDYWIPFCTGLVYAIPLMLFVYLMEKIAPPSIEDINARTKREPINQVQRKKIISEYFIGIVLAIIIYAFVTLVRDIRDNFSAEIWKEMGYIAKPSLFSSTEIPITLGLLLIIGALVLVKKSIKAFLIIHILIIVGFIVAGASCYLFKQHLISGYYFMLFTGLGLYLVYIPFNAVFFERMIASFGIVGNVGFLIYLADSFGYIGSIGVLLTKEVFKLSTNWTTFFTETVFYLSLVGVCATIVMWLFFSHRYKQKLATNSLV
jgi:MFS family permease